MVMSVVNNFVKFFNLFKFEQMIQKRFNKIDFSSLNQYGHNAIRSLDETNLKKRTF